LQSNPLARTAAEVLRHDQTALRNLRARVGGEVVRRLQES
jgi:hypothetical protein